jgi:four helix bundle protein
MLEYIRFLETAYGSSIEVEYQLELAKELVLVTDQNYRSTIELARDTAMTLNSLVRALRSRAHKRSSPLSEARRLRPEA